MADSENLPDVEDASLMPTIQSDDVRLAEIKAHADHSRNQKEVALRSIEVGSNDRTQDRAMYAKESTKAKLFISFLAALGSALVYFLVINGEVELIKTLVIEGGKVLLGFVGGAGFAYYRFGRQRDDDEN